MKALVKQKSEPGLWLQDVPEPKIGINDVLIRIRTSLIPILGSGTSWSQRPGSDFCLTSAFIENKPGLHQSIYRRTSESLGWNPKAFLPAECSGKCIAKQGDAFWNCGVGILFAFEFERDESGIAGVVKDVGN